MTTLHLETDTVRTTASQLKQAAEAVHSQMQMLNRVVQAMEWLGPSSEEFVMELEAIIRQLDALAEAGIALAGRVETEVAEWEDSASVLAGDFSSNFKLGAMGLPTPPSWFSPEPNLPFPPRFIPNDPGFDPPFMPEPHKPPLFPGTPESPLPFEPDPRMPYRINPSVPPSFEPPITPGPTPFDIDDLGV